MYLSNLQLVMMAEISQEPSTGYDLSKSLLDKGWKASHQQIYRDLAKLNEQSLVSLSEVPQSGKPDKKLYLLNDAGKSMLAKALDIEPSVPRIQDEALVHLFLANGYYFEQLELQLRNAIACAEEQQHGNDTLLKLVITREIERLTADHRWVIRVLEEIAPGVFNPQAA